MKLRAYVGAVAKLSRLRSGVWWTFPIATVAVLLTLSSSILTRSDLTPEANRILNFGGQDTAVYFNEYVPTTDEGFDLSDSIAELRRASGNTVCAEINAFVQADSRSGQTFTYREFDDSCGPEAWGYVLSTGRWPAGPGEIVVTEATGLRLGQVVRGATPDELHVVGVVSNLIALRSQVLIAASGTWRSWDWPDAASSFPRLSATVIAYTTAESPDDVASFYGARAQDDPRAALIEVATLGSSGQPNLDRFPFLYLWIAVPLAMLSALLGLGLRGRYLTSRNALLRAQGVTPRISATIVQLSTFVPMVVAAALGVVTGWLIGFGITPIVAWIGGRIAGPVQAPLDPVLRMVSGVVLAWIASFAAAIVRSSVSHRSAMADGAVSRSTTRQVFAIFVSGIAVFLLVAVQDVLVVIASTMLFIVVLSLVAPELVLWLSRIFDRGSPANRLAWRRVSRRPVVAALGVTAAAFAFGPVVAFGVILASDIAYQNDAARLPPSEGQALYYLSNDSEIDELVTQLVSSQAGSDSSIVYLPTLQTPDGGGVVATAEGFGVVEAVASVADLELLIRAPLSADAADALESGGVVWSPEYEGTTIWTYGGETLQPLSVDGAVTESFDERWARSSAGFILQSTADDLGLDSVDGVLVFGGINDAEADAIGDALINQGIDPSIVRTYRAEDPYAITPFQWGLIGSAGLVGIGILAATMRGSANALRVQSPAMLALGAPREWLGRVYLREGAATLLVGVVLGGVGSSLIAAIGLAQLGLEATVPFLFIGLYLLTLIVGLALVGLLEFARVRK